MKKNTENTVMKLKTFEQIILTIKNLTYKQRRFNQQCEIIFQDKDSRFFLYNPVIDRLMKILQNDFNDESDVIGWWVYECNFGKKTPKAWYKDGSRIKLDKIPDLYKYLIKN